MRKLLSIILIFSIIFVLSACQTKPNQKIFDGKYEMIFNENQKINIRDGKIKLSDGKYSIGEYTFKILEKAKKGKGRYVVEFTDSDEKKSKGFMAKSKDEPITFFSLNGEKIATYIKLAE